MAIVADLSGNAGTLDYSLVKPNRQNAGNPNGSVTPLFSGEIIYDGTNDDTWQALDKTNAMWVLNSPDLS